MADFVSPFWHWFIASVTVISLLACVWLIFANRSGKGSGKAQPTGHVWDEDLEELNNPLPRWWFNLFLITIIFSFVYLVLYPGLGSFAGILNWSQTSQYEEEMAAAGATYDPLFEQFAKTEIVQLIDNEEAIKAGERLFANYCSVCHGSDARGAPGFPNLRAGVWSWGGSPEALKTTIMTGREGVMPAWQGALGEDGVRDVASYVESLAGRDVDAGSANRGKQKYDMLCVACHLPDGTGNQALGAPNLTDSVWVHGASTYSIRESIATGRTGVMPAHGEFLGEARVHLLAAYVYSLSRRQ